MKAVLLNEWKIFKYYFLASIVGLALILLIFINNMGGDNRFLIYCIGIVSYTLRGQIAFGDKYSDNFYQWLYAWENRQEHNGIFNYINSIFYFFSNF